MTIIFLKKWAFCEWSARHVESCLYGEYGSLLQLVASNVSRFQHPAVVMQFFETVVRYDKFFTVEPQYVPEVLVSL